MGRFTLDRARFDQIVAAIRAGDSDDNFDVDVLEQAVDGEASGESSFDPNEMDGESDYLDTLMCQLLDAAVLIPPEGMPARPGIGTANDDGYRQIQVYGPVNGVYLGSHWEKSWHLTDGDKRGVEGVWAAAEAAVTEANWVLDSFESAVTAARDAA